MRWMIGTALGGVALLAAASSVADDSTAALGSGGIVFAKSADIRMADEDLRISPKKVQIHFAFVNDGAKDIDTVVAFPLPDVDSTRFWYEPLGTTTEDPVNFVAFKATVDGKPVRVEADQRAILKGKDVTAALKGAGVPVNVVMGGRFAVLDKLSAAKRKQLADAGIVETDGDNVFPRWIIRTRFHWKQHFPAGKTVTIDHSYQPVTGGAFFSKYEMAAKGSDDYWKKNYCMDAPTMSRIRKMIDFATAHPTEGAGGMLQIWSTTYILSTGNNWKGPIGKFHLVLDKMKAENTLSLCWADDLKKTGPLTFEMTAVNYAPTHDVKMVVLEPSRKQ